MAVSETLLVVWPILIVSNKMDMNKILFLLSYQIFVTLSCPLTALEAMRVRIFSQAFRCKIGRAVFL
jgi:hypothetical protein